MKKLSDIFDLIIFSLAICFLAFSVSFALCKSFAVSLIVTSTVFSLFAILFLAFKGKLSEKRSVDSLKTTKLEALRLFLLTERLSVIAPLLEKAFDLSGKQAFYLFDGELSEKDVLRSMRSSSSDHVALFCVKFDEKSAEIAAIFRNRQVELIDLVKIFDALSEKGLLPDLPLPPTQKGFKSRPRFSVEFVAKRRKRLCLAALFLSASAFFTPYKALYLCVAAALVIISILSFFVGKPKENGA